MNRQTGFMDARKRLSVEADNIGQQRSVFTGKSAGIPPGKQIPESP